MNIYRSARDNEEISCTSFVTNNRAAAMNMTENLKRKLRIYMYLTEGIRAETFLHDSKAKRVCESDREMWLKLNEYFVEKKRIYRTVYENTVNLQKSYSENHLAPKLYAFDNEKFAVNEHGENAESGVTDKRIFSDDEIREFDYDGFSKISSLYSKSEMNINFDFPIWKILKISDKQNTIQRTQIDETSILITTLPYLCSKEFETNSGSFIHLLDTVIFADTLTTVNMYSEQLSALNTKFTNIVKKNAALAMNSDKNRDFKVRYKSMNIRYVGFDDSRITGIDKVLKNSLEMRYFVMSERLCRQTYRRYGDVENPVYSVDDIFSETEWNANKNPANVLSVKIKGNSGENSDKILALMGVMLNESLKMMFPSISECIAVCPVYHNGEQIYSDGKGILNLYPKLNLKNSQIEENTQIGINSQ